MHGAGCAAPGARLHPLQPGAAAPACAFPTTFHLTVMRRRARLQRSALASVAAQQLTMHVTLLVHGMSMSSCRRSCWRRQRFAHGDFLTDRTSLQFLCHCKGTGT